ncbi:MAG: hypothetical protein QM737_01670 [Ferruginibacter sp.]
MKVGKGLAKTILARVKNEKIILSRVACLGQDVVKLKEEQKINLINQQKVRIDLLLDRLNGAPKPIVKLIEPHLLRKDILFMLVQQEDLPWFDMKLSGDTILLDSYSELTDQKFVHKKDGWAFACNYTDINHTDAFKEQFDALGLLKLDELEKYYRLYFDFLNKKYPGKKIIFLHFPTALDKRQHFIERGETIIKVIEKLTKEYPGLVSIRIADKDVHPHEDDDFPYHYGKETYKVFLKELNRYI